MIFLVWNAVAAQAQAFYIEEIDEKNTTPEDFAILVHGLPQDANEQEIATYFDQYVEQNQETLASLKGYQKKSVFRQVMHAIRHAITGSFEKDPATAKELQNISIVEQQNVTDDKSHVDSVIRAYKNANPCCGCWCCCTSYNDDLDELSSWGDAIVVFRRLVHSDKVLLSARPKQLSFKHIFRYAAAWVVSFCTGRNLPLDDELPVKFRGKYTLSVKRPGHPMDVRWWSFGFSFLRASKRNFIWNACMVGMLVGIYFFFTWLEVEGANIAGLNAMMFWVIVFSNVILATLCSVMWKTDAWSSQTEADVAHVRRRISWKVLSYLIMPLILLKTNFDEIFKI